MNGSRSSLSSRHAIEGRHRSKDAPAFETLSFSNHILLLFFPSLLPTPAVPLLASAPGPSCLSIPTLVYTRPANGNTFDRLP